MDKWKVFHSKVQWMSYYMVTSSAQSLSSTVCIPVFKILDKEIYNMKTLVKLRFYYVLIWIKVMETKFKTYIK